MTNSRRKFRRSVVAAALLVAGVAVLFPACTGPAASSAPTSAAPAVVSAASKGATPAKLALDWPEFQKKVLPFFAENCADCHEGPSAENGIHLDAFTDAASLERNADTLAKAMQMLSSHKMPPAKREQPPEAERQAVVAWLHAFDESSVYAGPPDPGRVTLRRLNRAEYNNTIRDLLGTDFRPADAFPADDAGYGFDNNGDVLAIAPVLMEKYLTAAVQSLDHVIKVSAAKPPPVQKFDVLTLEGTAPLPVIAAAAPTAPPSADAAAAIADAAAGAVAAPALTVARGRGRTGRVFPFNSEIHVDAQFAADGDYVFRFQGYNVQPPGAARGGGGGGSGPRRPNPQMTVQIDDQPPSQPIAVDQGFGNGTTIYATPPTHVTAGQHRVTLAFINGPTEEEVAAAPPLAAAPTGRRGGGGGGGFGGPPASPTGKAIVGVHSFEVAGPVGFALERMPDSYRKLFVALPSATVTKAQAAEKIISNFTERAFRRPVTEAELKALLAFWTKADADERPFQESIALTLQAVLISPNFLFRIEAEPGPGENGIHTLTEVELASRLSYFLWNSMPDDELFALARQGKLRVSLPAQVRRMLLDPKADSFAENFTGQWLQLRLVDTVNPDKDKYPAFDESLRAAMRQETRRFFSAIVQEDRSVVDFIGANFTFVNERLAKHYGLPGVTGEEFRRVTFPAGDPRGGLLGQASILALTSYNNRTSPVLRGKWVLENLLNAAPPPPPPNVPKLEEDGKAALTGTMRQRMEQHRTNPTCAACHSQMDPIGFGLENFDAIGAFRATDASQEKIDASGLLPDGRTFVGADGLRAVLLTQKDEFVRCLTDRLLTFALGRGLERTDRRFVREIAANAAKNNYRFSTLVTDIVTSVPFQKRAGPAIAPAPKKELAQLNPATR